MGSWAKDKLKAKREGRMKAKGTIVTRRRGEKKARKSIRKGRASSESSTTCPGITGLWVGAFGDCRGKECCCSFEYGSR